MKLREMTGTVLIAVVSAIVVLAVRDVSLVEAKDEKSKKKNLVQRVDDLEKEMAIASPVGSVIAWAGPVGSWPKNWKLCDGQKLKVAEYKALHGVLGFRYGHDAAVKFALPDYQGYFLRGAASDEKKERDPKRDDRFEPNSETDAKTPFDVEAHKHDFVGSVQASKVGPHTHVMKYYGVAGAKGTGQGYHSMADNFYRHIATPIFQETSKGEKAPFAMKRMGRPDVPVNIGKAVQKQRGPFTGQETRPKNVYVHWIIRVK